MSERRAMSPVSIKERSESIAERVIALDEYKRCDTLMCFVSTPIEVDTKRLFEAAFSDGKMVAAPRCENTSGLMDFFYIDSLDDLEAGHFGILEPKLSCERVVSTVRALCIVPGLAFDRLGFRLGFGRGFYDRYLSRFSGVSCGVIFDDNIRDDIPKDQFDRAVMAVVSESETLYTDRFDPIG